MTTQKMKTVGVFLLLLLSPWAAKADMAKLADYMSCYRYLALAPSMEPELWLQDGNKDIVVVPERRAGKSGIYVFTKEMSYFHAFEPGSKHGNKRYFELRLPGHKPIYLTLAERSFTNPADLDSSTEPQNFKYQKLEGGDAMDDDARKAMSWEVRRRMGQLVNAYQARLKEIDAEEKKLHTDLHMAAKTRLAKLAQLRALIKDRVESALDGCMLRDDLLLRGSVISQREEWAKVRPPSLITDVCPNCHAGSNSTKAN